MTGSSPLERRRRTRRRLRLWRPLLLALALVLVFVLGVALGHVIATDSDPDDTPVTTVRTVVPLASTQDTVTVTTTVASKP